MFLRKNAQFKKLPPDCLGEPVGRGHPVESKINTESWTYRWFHQKIWLQTTRILRRTRHYTVRFGAWTANKERVKEKKLAPIEKINPHWNDLFLETTWLDGHALRARQDDSGGTSLWVMIWLNLRSFSGKLLTWSQQTGALPWCLAVRSLPVIHFHQFLSH